MSIWERVRALLRDVFSDFDYRAYIENIVFKEQIDSTVYLTVSDDTDLSWVHKECLDYIERSWSQECSYPVSVCCDIVKDSSSSSSYSKDSHDPILVKESFINPFHTFDNFFVSSHNLLLVSACKHLALYTESTHFNPVFFFGDYGLGKTHLLHSVANVVLSKSSQKILYITAECFVRSYVASVRSHNTEFFRSYLRSCDVMLMDDIQFIMGKSKSEEELLHFLEEILSTNKKFVCTCDRPLNALETLNARLVSFMSSGLVCKLEKPDHSTFQKLLDYKISSLPLEEPLHLLDDVRDYLECFCKSNPRSLDGMLNNILAHQLAFKEPLSVEKLKEMTSSLIPPRKNLNVDAVKKCVCEKFLVSIDDLSSPSRKRVICEARAVAIFLVRSLTSISIPDIGKKFDRHHSSVIYSCKKVESNLRLQSYVTEIRRELAV